MQYAGRLGCLVLALIGVSAAGAPPATAGDGEAPSFERDVLPVLTSNCLGCHGGLMQKGGLDMRSIPLMLKGGESGPAVKPGDLANSSLWTALAADEMPKGKAALSAVQKQ